MHETVGRVLVAALLATSLGLVGGCAGSRGKAAHGGPGNGNAATVLAAGDAALAHGDPKDAGRLYLAALRAGASPAVVHTRMGNLYLGLGNAPTARLAYQEALKTDPEYAPALQGMGFAFYLAGNRDKAAEALARALDRDPSLPRAAALLGAIEAREGRPEAALAVYDKSLAIAFDADVENNRGLALLLLGRTEDAVGAFSKAASAKKSVRITNNLGLALCRLGRYDDAYAAFVRVADEAVALNNVGVCYMEAGDKAKAQEYFERAIAANPRYYPVAHDNLTRLSATEEVSLPSPVSGQQAAVPGQHSVPAPAAAAAPPPRSAVPMPATPSGSPGAVERTDRGEMP